ncbi:SGNH/GDSL hydrolase family protein [Amycolatopsis sp. NPDC052450]|uniref:SGNH/GDSL hydrolase family protein n=1 Tax=Amycolatopsis sp. NPDC052450 TaxID=3363937 RepID=UPI0037CA7854
MRLDSALIAAALALTVTVGAGSASAATAEPVTYVALGDSSVAGPGILPQDFSPCLRSLRNWPNVVARLLGAELTDVSCNAATIDDMAGRQLGFVAPQYDALRPDTDLVTITVGANDIGLGFVVPSCYNAFPQPIGSSCKARYTAGGVDQLTGRIAAIAPRVGAVLDEIHRRSPDARVVVVSYATYFKPGGCYPKERIWGVDADYLQATWDRLHATLATQAGAHNAEFVDVRTPSAGHGICESITEKWMEGTLPTSPATPFHPNATGMTQTGAVVAAAIGA